jgi:hypothetical protein
LKLIFDDKQVDFKQVEAHNFTMAMTEANFSGKQLRPYEAQIVAAFLPKCTYVHEYRLYFALSLSLSPDLTPLLRQ